MHVTHEISWDRGEAKAKNECVRIVLQRFVNAVCHKYTVRVVGT